jgi:cobalt-zinc-cadmium efflux system membrane fusion protein
MGKYHKLLAFFEWRKDWPARARAALALFDWRRGWAARARAAIVVVLAAAGALAILSMSHSSETPDQLSDASKRSKNSSVFYPTPGQWQSLTIQSVDPYAFRVELTADGKIAIDDDHSTLVFSPFAGRVTKLLARAGDAVVAGQPLFVVEATDMVQAQTDFFNAVAALNKAHAALELAKIIEQQNKSLYATKAGALRDLQQAQAATLAAQNDVRAAEISLEAVRNRLRILGKTNDEITKFSETGDVNPQTVIHSPISGTVVQRRGGPGQFVSNSSNNASSSDPTYVIGDLSTVWLVANIKETDGSRVRLGQPLEFRLTALPERVFTSKVDYVAEVFDPNSRRLLVRATIANPDKLLKPDMFAGITIYASDGQLSPAVPREAIIYEGGDARVWIATDDKSLKLSKITVGLINGSLVQVLSGLRPGEKIVTRGALFIDRAARGGES